MSLLLLLESDAVAGANYTQTLAVTLDGVTVAVGQVARHSQAVAVTLDGVAVVVAQSARHSQAVSATLDGVGVAVNQTARHLQSLAATLDGVGVSTAQTVRHSQALSATLDGVTVTAVQTASHPQALDVTLDGVSVSVAQSVAADANSQVVAVTLDDVVLLLTQIGAEKIDDERDGGHGGKRLQKPKLRWDVYVDGYEDPIEVVHKVEAKYEKAQKKPKKNTVKVSEPVVEIEEAPQQWVDYYEAVIQNLAHQREQQEMRALLVRAMIAIEEDEMTMLILMGE